MEDYFPPSWALFSAIGSDLSEPDTHHLSISVGLLRTLIEAALKGVRFDDEMYLQNNADLREAHRRGDIQSVKNHWIQVGYFEGRRGLVNETDEQWYINMYKDVAFAIKNGTIRSAKDHYQTTGEREWRVPHPALQDAVNSWRQAMLSQTAPAL